MKIILKVFLSIFVLLLSLTETEFAQVKENIKSAIVNNSSDKAPIEANSIIFRKTSPGRPLERVFYVRPSTYFNEIENNRIRTLHFTNAAELIGLLPGVSLIRYRGEGNKIVIRGMQPKYTKIMIDGVAISPTGSDDRSISMNIISTNSLEKIEVIKSPTANMDGDQMGGSVNLVTKTAIAGRGVKYEIITQGGYNDLRKSLSDYRIVGSISNRLFNNKFRFFAQISTERKNLGGNYMEANYRKLTANPDLINQLGITGVNLTNSFTTRNSYGGTLNLDYSVSNGNIYIKNFITSGKSNSQIYSEGYSRPSHDCITTSLTEKQIIYTNIFSYEQHFNSFNVSAKLSHSYSGSEVPNNIAFGFINTNDLTFFTNDTAPEDVPGYAKNDYNKFYWKTISDRESSTKGRQLMAKLDFGIDFTLSNQINGKIKFGGKFRYGEHSYDREEYGGSIGFSGAVILDSLLSRVPQFGNLPPHTRMFNYPLFYNHGFSHGKFLDEKKYNLGPVADIEMMENIVDIMKNARITYLNGGAVNEPNAYHYYNESSVINDYKGFERLHAGYLMAELNITSKVKFIPGIRYEANSTVYDGVIGHTGRYNYTYRDTTAKRHNEFWLPMIHLYYKPMNWFKVHLAYTKTLARPSYRRILPNRNFYSTNQNLSLTLENPYLEPELSENFDMYFTFSERHLGWFTIGAFSKNINGKILYQGDRLLNNPEKYNLDKRYTGISYSTFENSKKVSKVNGFEIDWQTELWYLPSFFSRIVLNVNYTKMYSEALYPRTIYERRNNPNSPPHIIETEVDKSYKDRLQDQPNDILNLGIGYDYRGFSTRLSMNYLSDIHTSSSFWLENHTLTNDYLRLDLSITQKLPWYGLQVFCNISNLAGTMEKSHFVRGQLSTMEHYGTAVYAGITWKAR